MTPIELKLLREVLNSMTADGKLITVEKFRLKHGANLSTIEDLEKSELLFAHMEHYILSLYGIKVSEHETSKALIDRCAKTLNAIKFAYKRKPSSELSSEDISVHMKPIVKGVRLERALTILSYHFSPKYFRVVHCDEVTSLVSSIKANESILSAKNIEWNNLPESVGDKAKNAFSSDRLKLNRYILSGLSIRGFKSIRVLDRLTLKSMNVLIGANGTGKSNFISFIRFLGAIFQVPGELQLYTGSAGGADTFLFDQSKTTPRLEAEFSFSSERSTYEYQYTLSTTRTDSFIFVEERYRASTGGQGAWQRGSDVGGKESGVYDAFVQGEQDAKVILWLMREFAIYQFHDTSENARIRKNFSAADNKRLKSDGGNLAPFLLRIKNENIKVYERITGTIRLIAPFFADFVLEPSSSQMVLLQWRERGSDVVFGAHQASDGTLRMMALVALLLQPQEALPAFIIIDEPELGLHPYAIEIIAGLIKSASESVQLIIATQSTALLNQFEPEDIIVVDRVNRETTFKRLNPEDLTEWLEDYSLSELWEKNVLGGRPSR